MKIKGFVNDLVIFCFILTIFLPLTMSQSNFNGDFANTNFFSSNSIDAIIPDDYSTIQEAIDNANPGEVIFVKSGLYKENILVNIENLTLIGENKTNTIIDGDKLSIKHAIEIISPNVTIRGFTIKNGWNEDEHLWDLSGIRINASNTKIIGNIITDNRIGLCTMSKTYNHTIKDNEFINDGLILGNYVYNHHLSIFDFRHIVENNTVNGKPLYYAYDKNDFTVPETVGLAYLVNCTNATIRNLNLNDTDFFINLAGCNKCNVINNTADNTDGELILFLSENCTIENNTVSNSLHGICLDYYSKNNIVRFNEVYENWIGISSITGSENNKIYSNKAYKNRIGIEITTYYLPMKSHDHDLYENELYKNDNGIVISKNSGDISVYNNSIYNNKFGISIQESEDNTISENIFSKNIFSAIFFGCSENNWNHNYWNRPRFLPKPILGYKNIGKIPVPWINIDQDPSNEKQD